MKNLETKLNTQEEAIRFFIEKLDIEMIDAFLDDCKTYQDMQKRIFIAKLNRVFEKFKETGDTYLASYSGSCTSCYKGKKGYTFVGNNSGNYLSIIIDSEKGVVNDMFECSSFANERIDIKLGVKFYIDDFMSKF